MSERSESFVHLHSHSEFSLLDGLSRIGEMTQRVADQGMPALAPRGMSDKEGKQDADYHHMILLARDDVGYRNLLALTTAAHLDGYYYKPRIDRELLARHAQDRLGTGITRALGRAHFSGVRRRVPPSDATISVTTTERAWDLRITRRCLREDLHLDPDAPASAEAHANAHPVVRAFVERRGQRPIGQETFRCGSEATGLSLYTLHSGDSRAATWHQEALPARMESEYERGIVWLLGVKPEHDYDSLCELGDDLLPAVDDYQAFVNDAAHDFARVLVEEVPPLLDLAELKRGEIIDAVIGNGIHVRLFHDRDDEAPLLTVAIGSRPMPNVVALVPQWQARLVLAFFAADDFDNLSVTTEIGGQPLERDESAYCSFPG